MLQYAKRRETWEGEEMEIVIPPTCLEPGMKKHVIVIHDECIFYSNDSQQSMWLQEGESVLKKKGNGGSIMVSEFLCACHGRLRISKEQAENLGIPDSAQKIIKPGKNKDGYWKSEDMVAQLRDLALPFFDALHPNCTGVFLFDQSTNHNAYSEDALLASRMTLNPKTEKKWRFKNGWYDLEGKRIVQPMFSGGQDFKGIRLILQERGLWRAEWKLNCQERPDPSQVTHSCCGLHALASQPDFLEQKTAIAMEVEKRGHIFELYPKYHCECNFIERYWGSAKRTARQQCDYSYKSLCTRVPKILDEVPLPHIKRFSEKAWRYITSYAEGLDAAGAERAQKQFKSHRRLRKDD